MGKQLHTVVTAPVSGIGDTGNSHQTSRRIAHAMIDLIEQPDCHSTTLQRNNLAATAIVEPSPGPEDRDQLARLELPVFIE